MIRRPYSGPREPDIPEDYPVHQAIRPEWMRTYFHTNVIPSRIPKSHTLANMRLHPTTDVSIEELK